MLMLICYYVIMSKEHIQSHKQSVEEVRNQARERSINSHKRRLIAENERYGRKQKLKTIGTTVVVIAGLLVAGKMDADSEREAAKAAPSTELIQENIAEIKEKNELKEWVESQEDNQ